MEANNNKITFFVIFLLYLTAATAGQNSPKVQWGHQLVTPTKDTLFGTMVVDSNDGIYIAILRTPNDASGSDYKEKHLLKFHQDGKQLWSRQLDATEGENAQHFDMDGLAADDHENIYVFGSTDSKLGLEKKGGSDAFIIKYNQSGDLQHVWQFGTPNHDGCWGLAVDADGNMYIAGNTAGAFARPNEGGPDIIIAAFNPAGEYLWRDQIGTAAKDWAVDIRIADNNDIYLYAQTTGSLARQNNGQADLVVARYNSSGKQLWLRQYGTPAMDAAVSMVIGEQGQVYIGGRTLGNMENKRSHQGYGDAFIARIAETGEILWIRQFGTPGWDKTFHMARFMDGSGDLLAGGCQYPTGRYCQAFCRRYSPEGELVWTKLFGSRKPIKGGTCGRAVAIDSDNNCYHAGPTSADMFGVNNGTGNVFIVKFDGMPEKKVQQ